MRELALDKRFSPRAVPAPSVFCIGIGTEEAKACYGSSTWRRISASKLSRMRHNQTPKIWRSLAVKARQLLHL
jgi:hypothetical protein